MIPGRRPQIPKMTLIGNRRFSVGGGEGDELLELSRCGYSFVGVGIF